MKYLLLLVILAFSFPAAGEVATEHVLLPDQQRIDVDKSYFYWRDPSGQQTINEIIRRQYDPRWNHIQNAQPVFQYTHDAIWFRFDLKSSLTNDGDYLLEVVSPYFDELEVHHVKKNHFGELYIAASFLAGDDRSVTSPSSSRFPTFPIQVETGASELVYVKVRSSSAINFSTYLWQRDAYVPEEQKAQAFYGFFFGLMVVMGFYNLVVWLFIREPMYLCYVFYAMSVVFYQASVSGFGALYLWSNVGWLLDKGFVVSSCLSFLFGALFVWHFLSIKSQHIIYQKVVMTAIWVYAGISLSALVLPEAILVPITQITGMVACVALLFTGCMLSWQGHQMARYFVVAWSLLLVGTVVHTLMLRGALPREPLTEYMQPVGMALEVMLLAIAMALRVNQERSMRKHAVKTALDLAKKVNAMNSEKLVLFSEDNQVLERQALEQDEELAAMRRELDGVKERLDALIKPDVVEGVSIKATLKKEVSSSTDADKIVSIDRGRKDSHD